MLRFFLENSLFLPQICCSVFWCVDTASSVILFSLYSLNLRLLCSYKSLDANDIFLEPISQKIIPQMLISLPCDDSKDFTRDYMKFMDDQFTQSAEAASRAYHDKKYLQVRCFLSGFFLIYISGITFIGC